MLIVITYC